MYELVVDGMTCGRCVNRVMKAIHSIDKTAQVNVDLKSKLVSVVSLVDLSTVRSAIAKAAYPVIRANSV